MKLLNNVTKLCFVTILGVSVIWACSQKYEEDEQNIPSINSPIQYVKFENYEFKQLINSSLSRVDSNVNNGQEFNYLISKLSDVDLVELSDVIIKNNSLDEKSSNISYLTVYTNAENPHNFKEKDILGVSFFIDNGGDKLVHHLYTRDGTGQMKLNADYVSFSSPSSMSVTDFMYIGGTLFGNEVRLKLVGFYNVALERKRNEYKDSNSFSNTVFDHSNFILKSFGCPCGSSGFDCNADLSGCDPLIPGPGGGGACLTVQTNAIAKGNGARLSNLLMVDKLRSFRDTYMSKSSIGNKYIKYYYQLSELNSRYELINTFNYIDYLKFGKSLTEILQNLSNSGNEQDILIDQDTRNQALRFIKEYRNATQNGEVHRILDDIENDINEVYKKDKLDVLKFIQTAE